MIDVEGGRGVFAAAKNIPTSRSERVRVKMPPVDDMVGVELLTAE